MPTRPHDGVESVGQGRHEVGDLGCGQRRPQLPLARLGAGEQQVVTHRGVHEVALLRDHPDDRCEHVRVEVAHVDPINRDPPGIRVVQPRQQPGDGRLARAGGPDEGQRRPGRNREREPGDGIPVGAGVAQGDALEGDRSPHGCRVERHRVRRCRDVGHEVEVLEDAGEQRHRRDPLRTDVEQPHERSEDAGLERREGDERADRHAARRRRQTGREVDQGRDDGEDDLHRGHPPAPGELRAQLEVDELVRGRREALRVAGRGAERLGQAHAAHREPLVDLVVEVGEVALLLRGHGSPDQGDLAREPEGRRDDEQRQQGQAPRERDHRDGRGDGGREVRGDGRGGRGDDALHPVDVVGQARLHLPAASAGEEAERLALEVGEHAGSQLVHDALTDLGRQPRLEHPEQLGDRRDGDHAADGEQQQADVLLGQRDVDDLAHQERLGQGHDARHDDDRDDDGHPAAVRAEEREHSGQRHGGVGELGLVAGVDGHRAAATTAAASAAAFCAIEHGGGCRGAGAVGRAGVRGSGFSEGRRHGRPPLGRSSREVTSQ